MDVTDDELVLYAISVNQYGCWIGCCPVCNRMFEAMHSGITQSALVDAIEDHRIEDKCDKI